MAEVSDVMRLVVKLPLEIKMINAQPMEEVTDVLTV
jgi:hypothetical protein